MLGSAGMGHQGGGGLRWGTKAIRPASSQNAGRHNGWGTGRKLAVHPENQNLCLKRGFRRSSRAKKGGIYYCDQGDLLKGGGGKKNASQNNSRHSSGEEGGGQKVLVT